MALSRESLPRDTRILKTKEAKDAVNRGAIFPIILLVALWTLFHPSAGSPQDSPWKKMDEGLFLGEFDSPMKSLAEDSKIFIVKIDPKSYSFKLLSASEHQGVRWTVRDWCQKHGLIAAINAGMYQKDGLTNVGYMKNFAHMNNPRLNQTYKAVLAFNRTEPSVPELQIIDLKCHAFEELKSKYETLIQNIRMISCQQENVWAKQEKKWSMAVFGVDRHQNGLFIFSEAPYTGHDFVNILLSLPVSIYNAMYLEGGPEASLYLHGRDLEVDKVGFHETGYGQGSQRVAARPAPNIIGIIKKK